MPRRDKPARKTRITIRIDEDVLTWFRRRAAVGGHGGYQSLVNLALRDYIEREPLEATLRRVIREELARVSGRPSPHAYDSAPPVSLMVADSRDSESEYRVVRKRQPRRVRRRH